MEVLAYGGPFHGQKLEINTDQHTAVVKFKYFMDQDIGGKSAKVYYTLRWEDTDDPFLRYEDIAWKQELDTGNGEPPIGYFEDVRKVKDQ